MSQHSNKTYSWAASLARQHACKLSSGGGAVKITKWVRRAKPATEVVFVPDHAYTNIGTVTIRRLGGDV